MIEFLRGNTTENLLNIFVLLINIVFKSHDVHIEQIREKQ